MKKLSILLGTLFIGGVFIFVSCTKTGSQGPAGQNGATGATGPIIYGTISGNVLMVNQYGAAVTTDYTGGYILLKNPSNNATLDSVIASSTGAYSISNVPTGTYNIECIYAGYGWNVHQNVEVNGNLNVDNKIAAIPNFNVTTATDSVGTYRNDTNYAYISGTIAGDPNGERTIIVFAGNSSSVSSNPQYYSLIGTTTVIPNGTTYSIAIPLKTIYANGFSFGNPIYFAVYGAANNYDYGDYTNFTYGQLTYTAISATPVAPSPSPLTLPLK